MNPAFEPQVITEIPANPGISYEVPTHAWSARVRFEDFDPTKPRIGIRLNQVSKLFREALSIQIIDRESVTIHLNSMNSEDAISLTKEDGRLFLDHLFSIPEFSDIERECTPAGAVEGDHRERPVINTAKGHLVTWLIENYPAQFGKFGKASTEGMDFYEAIFQAFQLPIMANDRTHAANIVLQQLYAWMDDEMQSVNVLCAHAARNSGAMPLDQLLQLRADVQGRILAARRFEIRSEDIRRKHDPALLIQAYEPPAWFMDHEEIKRMLERIITLDHIAGSEPSPGKTLTTAQDVMEAIEKPDPQSGASSTNDLKGRLVAVTGDSPRSGQIGEVISVGIPSAPGLTELTLKFGDNHTETFQQRQILLIGQA